MRLRKLQFFFLCTMQMFLSVSALQYQDLTPRFLHSMLFFFFWTAHCHYTLKIFTCRAFEVTKKAWHLNRIFFRKLKHLFYICNLWFYVNKMVMLVRNNQANVGLAFQIQTI